MKGNLLDVNDAYNITSVGIAFSTIKIFISIVLINHMACMK